MTPLGFGNFSVSGSSIEQTSFLAYLGLGGTEMGKIQVSQAESSEPHITEAVALMIGVFALAIVLLAISMVLANKRMKE
jgi:hypothetical protein